MKSKIHLKIQVKKLIPLSIFGIFGLAFFGNIYFVNAQTIGAALNRPNSVFVSENYAYVASWLSNTLEIIDISNPVNPIHKGLIANGTDGAALYTPSAVAVSGNYAYVTAYLNNALEIVDITDPTNPIHKSTLYNGNGGAQLRCPNSIFISGNYAYIAAYGCGNGSPGNIEIVDISNPGSPAHKSSVFFGMPYSALSVFVSGNYLYATVLNIGQSGGSLRVVDISNLSSPIIKGSIEDRTDGASLNNPWSVFVSGNYAYVASSGGSALEIVDITDPTNPIHKGLIADGTDGANLRFPKYVYVSGNYAYVATFQGSGLEIIDINDPAYPTHKGKINNGDGDAALLYNTSVFVSGNYAYVTSWLGNALEIVDISDPANPTHKSKLLDGEVSAIPGCVIDCFSNVLFLPGLMGSRLYDPGIDCGEVVTGPECGEKEIWVSTNDALQEKLSLNIQGKSVNNIYTKNDTQKLDEDEGETGLVDETSTLNIYKSFIVDLKNWKRDEIITDYVFIPYDWRLSLDDVITNGATDNDNNLSYNTSQNFSESFILQKLESLQQNSKSDKVTIVAHSNGGLVAKALIQKLKDTNNPLYDKIDKVILIAVPQVGTPDAVAGLLHGASLGHGLIMGADRSRQLSENMSSVYNFLPSTDYFSMAQIPFAPDKLITFENKPFFDPQISKYGLSISDEINLKNYILGTDGRSKPSFNDTVHPNIGNSVLYTQAENVHQILDNWQPSPNTKVIQVAGWGEETLAGLDYKAYLDFWGNEYLSYKPNIVIDGDGTVVVPSALWMTDTNPNVERWWVDLKKNNAGLNKNRIHRDILEVQNLRNFIQSRIEDTLFTDSENIIVNNTSTLTSNDIRRLHYTLHSPLTLGITDTQGRYTGQDPITKQIKEEIPNVIYRQIGDVQFLSAPDDLAYTVRMYGYEEGSFALDVEKQEGNNIIASTSFQGIPSSASTIATIDIAPNQEIENSTLKIDQNGDKIFEKILNATPDGITVYDVTPPELQITFDLNTKDVVFSAQDIIDKSPIIITTETSATLTDAQGNTTVIPFTKYKEKPTKLKFSYNKIIRNGITTIVPDTNIVYDWKEKKEVLTDLDTKVVIKGVEKYVFNYKKSNNTTTIKEKIGKDITTTEREGFVAVTLKTNEDDLNVSY